VWTAINFAQMYLTKPIWRWRFSAVRTCNDMKMPITQMDSHKHQHEHDHKCAGFKIDDAKNKWQRSQKNCNPKWPPDPLSGLAEGHSSTLPFFNNVRVKRGALNHGRLTSQLSGTRRHDLFQSHFIPIHRFLPTINGEYAAGPLRRKLDLRTFHGFSKSFPTRNSATSYSWMTAVSRLTANQPIRLLQMPSHCRCERSAMTYHVSLPNLENSQYHPIPEGPVDGRPSISDTRR
jgi:hypothetical protein